MIYDELKISLPFYNDIEKQNRYREHCAAVCNFKWLWPEGNLPPFQLRLESGSSAGVKTWYLRCADDDSLAIDLTPYKGQITASQLVDGEFYTYIGGALGDERGTCGEFYYEINIDEYVDYSPAPQFQYFSEVFTIVSDLTHPTFTQADPPLFSLWRWYDNEDHLTANLFHCLAVCPFYLLCGVDALLPFQFRYIFNDTPTNIIWELYASDGTCYSVLDEQLLVLSQAEGYFYITYNGDAFSDTLPCGNYYSKLTFQVTNFSGTTTYYFYSEPVYIHTDVNTPVTNFILQETGYKLLQETGFGLLQE
jgi:hypothetical protein